VQGQKTDMKRLEMTDLIEKSMNKISFIKHPELNDLMNTDKETREYTKSIINK